mmetsp:Transcript_80122/g.158732  ORF Transcript_80122/g.158732 Transcript_80122/m.158732 type:complete len:353 (+) Transcript_80122:72-1130(+)
MPPASAGVLTATALAVPAPAATYAGAFLVTSPLGHQQPPTAALRRRLRHGSGGANGGSSSGIRMAFANAEVAGTDPFFSNHRGIRVALAVGTAAVHGIFCSSRRRRTVATRAVDEDFPEPGPKEWDALVTRIEGERAVFEVTIPKPLGFKPANFPNRPGVGVAKVFEEGNTDERNRKILIENEPGMFVLEGDEVIAVNGTNVEGKTVDDVGPLVKNAEGDSITLTLCRAYYSGPVKVVFMPAGKFATMRRGIEITNAARVGVQEVSYSCKEGWCRSCWHTDTMWGTIYRACNSRSPKKPPPKNPRTIPEKWDNVMPLVLLNWPETLRREKIKKKRQEDEKKAKKAAKAAARA